MIPFGSYLALLSAHLRGMGGRVALLAVAVLASIGVALLNPQLLREVVDGALAGEERTALVRLAAIFAGLALVHMALAVTATWLAEDVGWRATNRLRHDLTSHVLHLDASFHTSHTPGHLIERVDGDVNALSNFFSAMVVQVLGNGLLLLGIVVLVGRESLVLGLLVGGLLLAGLALFLRLHAVAVPWWTQLSATQAEVLGQVGEVVDGAEDVVPNGAAPYVEERFARQLRTWVPQLVRAWTGYGLLWGGGAVASSAMLGAVVVVGGGLTLGGRLTVGQLFLVVVYVGMIDAPLHELRRQFQDLQKAGGGVARIEDLLAVRSRLPRGGGQSLPAGPLRLTFDDVVFGYGPDAAAAPVLHGVDVDVAPGRVLGVVGRTGSGKSTLARLAVRLHDVGSGQVRLGEVPVARVDDLRDRVGMVTQDVQLFRASVRDNLTFFDAAVDDERLLAVLDELSLLPWLERLPEGLDTLVGAETLSAGEAQLLAFARVFLRDPGLVVLDEASSRLDPVTEALLERAVDRLLAGRTGVVIAHRLHTLDRVDDVLVLDAGRVVEHGPRQALADDPESVFSRLLAAGLAEVEA